MLVEAASLLASAAWTRKSSSGTLSIRKFPAASLFEKRSKGVCMPERLTGADASKAPVESKTRPATVPEGGKVKFTTATEEFAANWLLIVAVKPEGASVAVMVKFPLGTLRMA